MLLLLLPSCFKENWNKQTTSKQQPFLDDRQTKDVGVALWRSWLVADVSKDNTAFIIGPEVNYTLLDFPNFQPDD